MLGHVIAEVQQMSEYHLDNGRCSIFRNIGHRNSTSGRCFDVAPASGIARRRIESPLCRFTRIEDYDVILGDNGQVLDISNQRIATILTTDTVTLTGGVDVIEGNEDDDIKDKNDNVMDYYYVIEVEITAPENLAGVYVNDPKIKNW